MNTIFKKQLFFNLGIITMGFAVMAAVLSHAFNTYFTNQKIEALTSKGLKIAELFEEAYFRGSMLGIINLSPIYSEVQIVSDYLDASFIYIDINRMVIVDTLDRATGKSVDLEAIQPLFDGDRVVFQGKLGGIFSEPTLTVGCPIKFRDTIIGAVLLNSSIPELKKTVTDVYLITVISILIVALLSFSLTYFSSKKISKPLMEMNNVAKVIANGDFEKRIDVNSRDEVGQLAASFNDMAESLFLQDKLRQEFMANISHDLRSPLTSIRGFLEAIMDGTIPEERREHYLKIVLEETERLSSLANNILDIEKVTLSEMPINETRFDLNELLRKTTHGFEQRALEKKHMISLSLAEEKSYVSADYEKIQRVIYNLLDNAIKFTPESGRICIITEIKNDKAYVTIKDTGNGIDKDEQKRVFDRFYKADASRGRDKKGSGLGLSIVKEFIKAHGEKVTLISEPGKGSEFTFSLPYYEAL